MSAAPHSEESAPPCDWTRERPHAWLSNGPVRGDTLCHHGCGLRYGDWKSGDSGRTEGRWRASCGCLQVRCEFTSMGMRCVLPPHGDKGHCPSICNGGPCGLCSAADLERGDR